MPVKPGALLFDMVLKKLISHNLKFGARPKENVKSSGQSGPRVPGDVLNGGIPADWLWMINKISGYVHSKHVFPLRYPILIIYTLFK